MTSRVPPLYRRLLPSHSPRAAEFVRFLAGAVGRAEGLESLAQRNP